MTRLGSSKIPGMLEKYIQNDTIDVFSIEMSLRRDLSSFPDEHFCQLSEIARAVKNQGYHFSSYPASR